MKLNQQTRGQGADPAFPRLLGERLCLNFVNTIESPRDNPVEYLHSYSDLVRWGRHVGMLDEAETERLLNAGKRQPKDAATVFQRALLLRAAIARVFRSIATHKSEEPDVDTLQTEYLAALAHGQLAFNGTAYEWVWEAASPLDKPLWAVARSAVEVLTQDDLMRVKECPGAGDCGWLFYDTSKNNSRHWCSMEGCGSRVKMRRQYARQRAE